MGSPFVSLATTNFVVPNKEGSTTESILPKGRHLDDYDSGKPMLPNHDAN
jgi:hypothetical protein